MKNRSMGFWFSALTCLLSIAVLVLLLIYSSRGGKVQGTVYAALVASILCEGCAFFGEKPWTDFTSVLGATALAYVMMVVLSDGIWNIAEAMNGIKMVGLPELASMNYTLAAVNLAAIVTAIVASFLRKSKA